MPMQVKFIHRSSSKTRREAKPISSSGQQARTCILTLLQYQPTRCQEQGHLGGSCLPTAPSSRPHQSKCGSSCQPNQPSRQQQQNRHLQ
uniref:Uncharacterized protein n=1 Tax=Arundo donax TaxID=35708 RepID=A0A0A9CQ83_ARUDO